MHRTDAIATLKSGIRLEYVVAAPDDAKSVKETLVLIHGYPQTWCVTLPLCNVV